VHAARLARRADAKFPSARLRLLARRRVAADLRAQARAAGWQADRLWPTAPDAVFPFLPQAGGLHRMAGADRLSGHVLGGGATGHALHAADCTKAGVSMQPN